MISEVFPAETLAAFGDAYPLRPAKLAHSLLTHPLLTLEALEGLATSLPKESVASRFRPLARSSHVSGARITSNAEGRAPPGRLAVAIVRSPDPGTPARAELTRTNVI